jgi:hypothetical protein
VLSKAQRFFKTWQVPEQGTGVQINYVFSMTIFSPEQNWI